MLNCPYSWAAIGVTLALIVWVIYEIYQHRKED